MAQPKHVAFFVLAVCAIPLLFALMPLLAPILGAVLSWNTAMLGSDSGNLQVNAALPWFALGSVVAAFFIVGGAVYIFGGQLSRGR